MNKRIDLHIHSNFSDGDYSVEDLICKIRCANISVFSVTDHDEFGACIKIVKENLVPNDLIFVTGIEFSTIWNGIKIHILGYGMNVDNEKFLSEIKKMSDMRKERMSKLVDFLKEKHNIKIACAEIDNLYGQKNVIGKPDIAKILVDRKLVTDVNEAFDKYLSCFSLPKSKIKSDEAIRIIKDSGGISVLAHPKKIIEKEKYSYEQIFKIVCELKNKGLDGIETYYSQHTNKDINKFKQMAETLNLLVSGGSDYHGKTTKPNIELGKLALEKRESIEISDTFWEKGKVR
jgi:predicted metal-dependent phosphoesterase TrpH